MQFPSADRINQSANLPSHLLSRMQQNQMVRIDVDRNDPPPPAHSHHVPKRFGTANDEKNPRGTTQGGMMDNSRLYELADAATKLDRLSPNDSSRDRQRDPNMRSDQEGSRKIPYPYSPLPGESNRSMEGRNSSTGSIMFGTPMKDSGTNQIRGSVYGNLAGPSPASWRRRFYSEREPWFHNVWIVQ